MLPGAAIKVDCRDIRSIEHRTGSRILCRFPTLPGRQAPPLRQASSCARLDSICNARFDAGPFGNESPASRLPTAVLDPVVRLAASLKVTRFRCSCDIYMKVQKFYHLFCVALVLPAAFLYWPAGCARPQGRVSAPPGDAAGAMASSAAIPSPHPALALAEGAIGGGGSVADVAERVSPSVVAILSERVSRDQGSMPFPFPFFGPTPPREHKQQGLGSGVVVSSDGRVLTNNHVIEDAQEIKVTTSDGREFEAEVVGADEKSDIAVLQLKGDMKELTPLPFGDSGALRLGEFVLAVGNPFGIGQTVTMGIVSAKGRADVGIVDYEDFIQTDAAINPGNSGGALVNLRGELIGINTAILSRSGGYQGIGFAIPTNMARPIVDSLVKHGKVVRGFLGVNIQDVDAELAAALGLDAPKGVLVAGVTQGSAADRAGIRRRDVVTAVDGVATDSSGHLRNLIAGKGAGANVQLSIIRDGKPKTISVKLEELPDTKARVRPGSKSGKLDSWGLSLAPLSKQQQDSTSGKVAIAAVGSGSPAAEAGLRPGDVVLEINKQKVIDVAQARRLFAKAGDSLLLVVEQRGVTRFVVLKR
jgi:serine protease Do